jgi:hypothetical protein
VQKSEQNGLLINGQNVTKGENEVLNNDNLKLKFYFPHKEGAVYQSLKTNNQPMKTSQSFSDGVFMEKTVIPKSRSVLSDTESNTFLPVSSLKISSRSSSIVPCCPSLPSSNVSIPASAAAENASHGANKTNQISAYKLQNI